MLKNNLGNILYKNNWKIINGTIPVIFSAPHAVAQVREWVRKQSDKFTGKIVDEICKITWAYGIVRVKNFGDDPNYYNDWLSWEFKQEIVDLMKSNGIKYWFDIHGCIDDLWFSINVSTNYWENVKWNLDFLLSIKNSLVNDLWDVVVDKIFDAWKDEIVSTFVSNQTQLPYVQLELCRSLREDRDYVLSLLNLMVKDLLEI